MVYPNNIQTFSNGYEQVSLQSVIAQIRRPMINSNLIEDLHYWQTGETKSYIGENVFIAKPSSSGYIKAIGTDEVEMDELFVTPQIAESFELGDFCEHDFLIATADHASQLERFFI